MSHPDTVVLTADHDLGTVRTMPQFRRHIAQGPLTDAQRRVVLGQAEILIGEVYAHLPLKRAMHAIDPLQALRLLRHRLADLTETEFHGQLQRIFLGLHDLHTNYILPSRYAGFAFLGIFLERCVDNGRTAYLVTKTFDHITGDPQLKPGVEVTHWNGTPIHLAVEANAAREAGSNKAAQLAQGLQNMTLRSINMSLPPDEDWVDVTYKVDGTTHETRTPWRVFESAGEVTTPGSLPSLPTGVATAANHLVGMDLRTELTRRMKRRLFAPATLTETPIATSPKGRAARSRTAQPLAAGPVPSSRPDELKARIVETPSGTFGHLRIFTFHMQDQDINAFLNEVARLLSVLPSEGLVLDVRGNGGGYVIAAEFLLQFFSPHRVTPEPFQFVSTPGTTGLATTVADYQEWKASLQEAVTTGSAYSTAFPLYPIDVVNSVGQLYQGPVVLVTDAQCYSACDIFAAGFQDHQIGPVLGVEANTGAGGANVVTHEELRTEWTDGELKPLPKGVQMRVALRRCLRVGTRMGQPVEDLGVVPDARHDLTKRDLLEENADLMAAAGALLAQGQPRVLRFTAAAAGTKKRKLTITTAAVAGIDVYVNGRPVATTATDDGTTQLTVPAAGGNLIRIEGYDPAGTLVAATQQRL
ncbi:S41 family peptidase [Kribbella sp. CA-294648]|uniref:S41 family peptidase n=1 Tax=Kribbella sp. CA-294648 TaxID=3239948 RepID=UPI003D931890